LLLRFCLRFGCEILGRSGYGEQGEGGGGEGKFVDKVHAKDILLGE
jgi:hypothetical protein